jgi:hypothetical protein
MSHKYAHLLHSQTCPVPLHAEHISGEPRAVITNPEPLHREHFFITPNLLSLARLGAFLYYPCSFVTAVLVRVLLTSFQNVVDVLALEVSVYNA